MPTNEQVIVEHIVNIDTVAQNITSVSSVAAMAMHIAALAGMLPDVGITVQIRADIMALARSLSSVRRVADALPLLEAVPGMIDDVRAVLGVRSEIHAITGQLEAVRTLYLNLDILLRVPEHAEAVQQALDAARTFSDEAVTSARDARMSQLNAEAAEGAARSAAENAAEHEIGAEAAAEEARKAAGLASAVAGLPDASAATPGDSVIWNGSKFVMGGLDATLASRAGIMGVADGVLNDVAEAKTVARGVDAKAEQALGKAADAKDVADGVDAKATRALSEAATAKGEAAEAKQEAAGAVGTTDVLANRVAVAEEETLRVSLSLGSHAADGDLHTSMEVVAERILEAVNAGLGQIRDGGDGSTLPENVNTLKKLANLLDDLYAAVDGFLNGPGNPDDRPGMLATIEATRATLEVVQADMISKTDIVDSLDSDSAEYVLSAAQGAVLSRQVAMLDNMTTGLARPWISYLESVPQAWPQNTQQEGLLLVQQRATGESGADVADPVWYMNDRGKPARLILTAVNVRMTDGTTVQTGLVAAAMQAEAAQTAAQAAAADAAEVKTLLLDVDAKTTQALSEAEAAKTDAATAKTEATAALTAVNGVDVKAAQALAAATAAQTDAGEAKTLALGVDDKATQALAKADEALTKSPEMATNTTPGIVKGSGTVHIGADGSVNVISGGSGGGGGYLVGSPVYLPGPALLPGFRWPDRSLVLFADWPELKVAYDAGLLSVLDADDANYFGRWVRNDQITPTGLYLPNLGGVFLRSWRPGVQTWDNGRKDGQVQGDAMRNITGYAMSIRTAQGPSYGGVLYQTSGANIVNGSGASNPSWTVNLNASRQVPTASENRPINVAWALAIYLGKPAPAEAIA